MFTKSPPTYFFIFNYVLFYLLFYFFLMCFFTFTIIFSFFFNTRPGDKVDVTVLRNGEEMTIEDVVLIKQDEGNIRWIAR